MRTQDRDRRHRDGWGSRLGHGTPELDRSHLEGTYGGPGATPSPLYSLFPLEKLSPSHPLQGHTQAHAVTLLENWAISWKVALDSQFPPAGTAALMWLCHWIWDLSWQNRCICQEKSLLVELGGFSWSPRETVEFPPSPFRFWGGQLWSQGKEN